MKKLVLLLFAAVAVIACNTEKDPEQNVREMAKHDIMEKLSLPDGTQFNEQDFEVTRMDSETDSLDTSYLVKVSVKAQDRDGNEIVKVHTLQYDSAGEGDEFTLSNFETE